MALKIKIFVLLASIVASITSCSTVAPKVDITKEFTKKSEVERLRYFKEIDFSNTRKKLNLTGKGVRITIMGEEVDASHPDLNKRIVKQYNTSFDKNNIISAKGNQPYGFEKMEHGSGHGTHIAGTIAAECDGIGIQGIACGSTIDVYSIGTDGEVDPDAKGWGDTHEFARLLTSFSIALNDVTRRNESKITTGSFNIESPAIRYDADSKLSGKNLTEIITMTDGIDNVDDLFTKGFVKASNKLDEKYLVQISKKYDDPFIAFGSVLSLSKEWAQLETAIQKYQKSGGVYLVTESNYKLGRTSVLNAMPSLSNKVDKDLWLSVVMVAPKDFDKGFDKVKSTADLDKILDKAEYFTPINHCGKIAAEYCILTPSYHVFSTMTQKIREDEDILFELEGRFYQTYSGHSMGAPIVAATLALMQEYNIKNKFGYSMKDLVRILKKSANRKFPTYDPDKHGQGILDVSNALKMMRTSQHHL